MKKVSGIVLIGLVVLGVVYAGTGPENMTRAETNKFIVKAALRAMTGGDWQRLQNLYSPKFQQHGPNKTKAVTWSDFELSCRFVHNKIPTLRYEIQDLIAEGDKVVVRLKWIAKYKRHAGLRSETEEEMAWSEIDIMRIVDGKIIEEWCEYDRQYRRNQIRAFALALE